MYFLLYAAQVTIIPRKCDLTLPNYTDEISDYVARIEYDNISSESREKLKHHLLDSIGCALNALTWEPIEQLRTAIEESYGTKAGGKCTLIGLGPTRSMAPQVAALWNGALVRYVDFMDGYRGKKQSCHPSDTIAAVLASAQFKGDQDGEEFLTAMGIAYHVFARFIDFMPTSEEEGFDHTVHLGMAIAAGASKALRLDRDQTSNALDIAGATSGGLDVTRSDYLSNWKGLASAGTAFGVVNSVMLAKNHITGPSQVFEGPNGIFHDFDQEFRVNWESENCEGVMRTDIKEYNVELHDQSLIEGLFELKEKEGFDAEDVDSVGVETIKQAFNITGSGKNAGDKYDVRTKDQADHSIPYAVAVSIIDDDLYPEQYRPQRIRRDDVQRLLRKVTTNHNEEYDKFYPSKLSCKLTVGLNGGQRKTIEKQDWEGMFSRPMSVEKLNQKFRRITSSLIDQETQDEIIDAVLNLDKKEMGDLFEILEGVEMPKGAERPQLTRELEISKAPTR